MRKTVGDVSLYFGNFLAKETSTFHRKVFTETVEEVKSISESIIISFSTEKRCSFVDSLVFSAVVGNGGHFIYFSCG